MLINRKASLKSIKLYTKELMMKKYQKLLKSKQKRKANPSSLESFLKKRNIKQESTLLTVLLKTSQQPLFFGSLIILFVVLMVPTAIVYFSKEENTVTTFSAEVPVEQSVQTQDESSIHVSVQRSATEQMEDVPLETYVARVVASEMPAEFSMEALKAQSLAARTYVINYMLHEEEVSIADDERHQVYKNDAELREQFGDDYQWKMDKIMQAVDETAGEILTYNDELITPVYFSTSNGYTENSEEYWQTEIPYLRSVESPWDKQSPKYKEQATISLIDIETALNLNLQLGVQQSVELTKTTGNRVKQLTINGTSFTGREIREKLNLPSSDFSIEQKGDYFIFTTRGYGHGVGMSQYGANGMAEEGKTYEEIIAHYYQDVTIDRVDDVSRALAFN